MKMHSESTDVKPLYYEEDKVAITSRSSKSKVGYLALFNRSDSTSMDLEANLSDLGYGENPGITNIWTGEELEADKGVFVQNLEPHASGLYKIEPAE